MSNPAIDLSVFANLKESVGEDFIDELTTTFLDDAPKLIAEMHRALTAGDAATLRRAAHSLKSSSASFGAARVAELAKSLEMAAQAGALESAPALLVRLAAEYRKAAEALRQLTSG